MSGLTDKDPIKFEKRMAMKNKPEIAFLVNDIDAGGTETSELLVDIA